MTFLQCIRYHEKAITIDCLIIQDTALLNVDIEKGIPAENSSVKLQYYKTGEKNGKPSCFHTYTMGIDGFSSLLNLMEMSHLPFLVLKDSGQMIENT